MAFEPNLVPKELRPVDIARTVSDETRIAPHTATSGRNVDGYYVNPPTNSGSHAAVFYPPPMPESGFVGVGYSNAPAPRGVTWVPMMPTAVVAPPSANSATAGYRLNPNFGVRASPSPGVSDQASDESGEESVSGKKVKLLCSFGGKILPRPSDGMLRYVGGQTRIITIRKDISYNELVQKMAEINGQNAIVKYQLPDEDLDALVLVSCPDDLENMMEEYEKLVQRSTDGMAKLRVFLFSSSEIESAGILQLGDTQSNKRYFEAVNGIGDGIGGGMARKDSMTSAASTQNSDLSGTEAIDNLGQGQGDITGPPATVILSPRADSATSQELAPKVVHLDPSRGIYVEASNVPSGTSAGMSVLPQPLSFHPHQEFDRSAPTTVQKQQIGVELLHPAVNYPPNVSYLQSNVAVGPHQVSNVRPHQVSNVGPQQVTLNGADYVQVPAQMGFPSQLLGTAGPVFAHPQYHDSASSVPSHQFIPAGHMAMAQQHVNVNQNVVRPIPQPPRNRLERNAGEIGIQVFPIPADQAYNAYQGQVQPAVVGAGYGWNQVSQPQQVVVSEGWVPHPQGSFPERIPRLPDCFMCEKALPHAHSDTIVQDQIKSTISAQPDLNQVYHSLHLDDKTRALQMNRVVVPGAAGECVVDQSRKNMLSHMDRDGKSHVEKDAAPQNILKQYGNDRVNLQMPDNPDQFEVSVPQSVVGLGFSSPSPYGVVVSPPSQLFHEGATQQQVVPVQYQVRQEISKPVNTDVHTGRGTTAQLSDNRTLESPREHSGKLPSPREQSGKLPTAAPKEDSAELYDHVKQTDGRMGSPGISPADAFVHSDQSKEELLEVRPHQNTVREPYPESSFNQPRVFPDITSQHIPDETSPSSDDLSYLHNIRALESFNVSQPPPPLATTISYQQPKFGNNCLASNEDPHGNIAFFEVDSTYPQENVPPVGEEKDNASLFPPKAFLGDLETEAFGGDIRSLSPSDRLGNGEDSSSNSLFSNQDPWNMRHDSHFPPPRPTKIVIRREGLSPRDRFGENHLINGGELPINSGGLATGLQWDDQHAGNMNFGSDQTPTTQGSAEDSIKQELQAVAEGVAASVLQSSAPVSPNSDVQSIDGEGNKAKLVERTNLGSPVSDVGRLQIIKNNDLEELRELGSGTFGTVYHGKWRGTDVAIKRINDRCFAGKASEQERMRDDFWNEANKLADLHHPNVVAFYGVVLDGPGGSVATVTEYMVNGSLRTALRKNERNLDKRKRLLIAMDVAFGMEYLHGKNIVHFDLKSDNLLVNLRDPHRPICKVGDLGLSKVKCQTLISGGVRGTLPWMAPELLNGSSSLVSEKVDVFSFGIVMWELLTGEDPYADLHYGAIIGGIVSNTLRPPVPEACDPDWKSLMERCWSADPSERPNFIEIANELRSMASKLPSKAQSPPAQQPPPPPVVKT